MKQQSAFDLLGKDYYQDWLTRTKWAREHPRRSASAIKGHKTRKVLKQAREDYLRAKKGN